MFILTGEGRTVTVLPTDLFVVVRLVVDLPVTVRGVLVVVLRTVRLGLAVSDAPVVGARLVVRRGAGGLATTGEPSSDKSSVTFLVIRLGLGLGFTSASIGGSISAPDSSPGSTSVAAKD